MDGVVCYPRTPFSNCQVRKRPAPLLFVTPGHTKNSSVAITESQTFVSEDHLEDFETFNPAITLNKGSESLRSTHSVLILGAIGRDGCNQLFKNNTFPRLHATVQFHIKY